MFVNEGYGEIRNEMVDAGFAPVGVDLPVPDLPAVARALGCEGTRWREPAGLPDAVAAAFGALGADADHRARGAARVIRRRT